MLFVFEPHFLTLYTYFFFICFSVRCILIKKFEYSISTFTKTFVFWHCFHKPRAKANIELGVDLISISNTVDIVESCVLGKLLFETWSTMFAKHFQENGTLSAK